MSRDTIVWTVIIICKITILLAILFCCTNNRRKRRNLAYQQTLISNNTTTYPQHIITVPYSYQSAIGTQGSQMYQPHPHMSAPNQSLVDLPPSYSEIFNQKTVACQKQ